MTSQIWSRIALIVVLSVFFSCRGPQGPAGPSGPPGEPCSVLQGEGFALIECPRGDSALVFDGQPSTPISWTDPCPSIPTQFPELLLVQDGEYYAVYASRNKIHLTRLVEGVQYRTTDGRNCQFTIGDLL
jgi:hypothetical protein